MKQSIKGKVISELYEYGESYGLNGHHIDKVTSDTANRIISMIRYRLLKGQDEKENKAIMENYDGRF